MAEVRTGRLYHCTTCEVYGEGPWCWCCESPEVVFYDPEDHPLNNMRQPERDLILD